MHCAGPCASTISHIHMEATVTEKICISLHCAWHNHSASCDMLRRNPVELGSFAFEYDHLHPWRANTDSSAQFPSKAPKKRLVLSLTSHLDDPEVRGQGCSGAWRGLHSSCLLCSDGPCCLHVLLFLCS